MSPGAALIVILCGTNISANVRDYAVGHEAHWNLFFGSKVTVILQNWLKDYSALLHFRNCNLTSESPQNSTRRPQTPDKLLGSLCAECATQDVFFLVLWTGGRSHLRSWTSSRGAKHLRHSYVSKLKFSLICFLMTKKGPLEAKISK